MPSASCLELPALSYDKSFGCREEMLDFMFACHEVVQMIMECFARGLGLKEDFFRDVKHLQRSFACHVRVPVCLYLSACLGPRQAGTPEGFHQRQQMPTSLSTSHVHVLAYLCLSAYLHVHICLAANTS